MAGERRDGETVIAPNGAGERALLVGVSTRESRWDIDSSLDELQALAESAGATVVGRVWQRLVSPNPRHYVGKGKLHELKVLCAQGACDLVVFDDELSPNVQRTLEEELGCKVIDRTLLILDIFARRARAHEGRVQVELAQLQYMLPRLTGKGTALSRLGGGIGTRGPGETKLEFDRRRIRTRIALLKEDIESIRAQRKVRRVFRKKQSVPLVALVGYTNVGKSTLLNALTGADAFVEDKLFATLDPLTRRVLLPNGREALVTDTVGLIAKLPTTVVAAFLATLEELREADLLVHVVDITHPQAARCSQVVGEILSQLRLIDKPVVTAINKLDALIPTKEGHEQAEPELASRGLEPSRGTVVISARLGWGLDRLLTTIEEKLHRDSVELEVCVPYAEGRLVELFRKRGEVVEEHHTGEGTVLRGLLPSRYRKRFVPYLVQGLGGSTSDATAARVDIR